MVACRMVPSTMSGQSQASRSDMPARAARSRSAANDNTKLATPMPTVMSTAAARVNASDRLPGCALALALSCSLNAWSGLVIGSPRSHRGAADPILPGATDNEHRRTFRLLLLRAGLCGVAHVIDGVLDSLLDAV